MEERRKIQAFEYLVYKLLEWYSSCSERENNDLSILKVLKLLFFSSAINTKKDTRSVLLDNTFDSFYAMPYGHVESDVYNFIKRQELQFYTITKIETQKKKDFDFFDLNLEVKNEIDKSIKSLKEKNENLILMDSFELVELSHTWFSWKYCYDLARKKGVFSEKIPAEIIKSENKILHLN